MSVDYTSVHGCRSWELGVLTPSPMKYIGWVTACLDPLKCHILPFEAIVGQLCKPHNVKDERLVSKMEGNTSFSRHLIQFDVFTRLTPIS